MVKDCLDYFSLLWIYYDCHITSRLNATRLHAFLIALINISLYPFVWSERLVRYGEKKVRMSFKSVWPFKAMMFKLGVETKLNRFLVDNGTIQTCFHKTKLKFLNRTAPGHLCECWHCRFQNRSCHCRSIFSRPTQWPRLMWCRSHLLCPGSIQDLRWSS